MDPTWIFKPLKKTIFNRQVGGSTFLTVIIFRILIPIDEQLTSIPQYAGFDYMWKMNG